MVTTKPPIASKMTPMETVTKAAMTTTEAMTTVEASFWRYLHARSPSCFLTDTTQNESTAKPPTSFALRSPTMRSDGQLPCMRLREALLMIRSRLIK